MSGWDLTLVYMYGPYVASVEICVVTSLSAGTSSAIRFGYCGMLGSSISTACEEVSGTSISSYISGIYIYSSYSLSSTIGSSAYHSY